MEQRGICIMENIEKMKKIVLHLHLDGSLRPETVLQCERLRA